jgi:hypothetical protein
MEKFEVELNGRSYRFQRPRHGEWDHLACVLLIQVWQRNNEALAEAVSTDQMLEAAGLLSSSTRAIERVVLKALIATREDQALDLEAFFAALNPLDRAARILELAVRYSEWVCPSADLGNSPMPCGASAPAGQESPVEGSS